MPTIRKLTLDPSHLQAMSRRLAPFIEAEIRAAGFDPAAPIPDDALRIAQSEQLRADMALLFVRKASDFLAFVPIGAWIPVQREINKLMADGYIRERLRTHGAGAMLEEIMEAMIHHDPEAEMLSGLFAQMATTQMATKRPDGEADQPEPESSSKPESASEPAKPKAARRSSAAKA